MKSIDFAEIMGKIDKDIIEQADNAVMVKRKKTWYKWGAIAAGFAVIFIVFNLFIHLVRSSEGAGTNEPIHNSITNDATAIYVNDKLYVPNFKLSKKATEENIGNMVGFVSFDNKNISDICVFEYIPNDGVTNRIIIPSDNAFYVYSFYSYAPHENTNWPATLLDGVAYIEIRDPNYEITNNIVYTRILEVNDLIEFLTNIGQKHSMEELNKYYFEKFKNQFKEGELWIDQNGGIAHGGNATVSMKFSNLIRGNARSIVVIMKDNTSLSYTYLEGAGVIFCSDSGYILTQDQIKQINYLIGLS